VDGTLQPAADPHRVALRALPREVELLA
jgi:hypothetical protein